MKRVFSMIGVLMATALVLAGCDKDEGVDGPGGSGVAGVPDALVLARTFPPLLANGVDQIPVTATVVDGTGRGLSDIGVAFTTTRGSIEPFATTDDDGVATTRLTSEAGATDITATITAVAVGDSSRAPGLQIKPLPAGAVVLLSRTPLTGDLIQRALKERVTRLGNSLTPASSHEVNDQTTVTMRGVTVSLSASPTVIPADGLSSSRVTATLIETTSRVPLDGQEVRFGATAGTITGRVDTDETGSAVATLTGTSSGAQSRITVFYGNTLTAEVTVTFSALDLTLAPRASALSADGVSSTHVVARLINAERNPVSGARVEFSTTLGTVTSPVETDPNGEARATLTAGTTTGTARITASFAGLSRTADVTFAAPPATASLLLDVSPSTIPADGAARAGITATVLDAQANRMPDGTLVTFSIVSGGGTLIAPARLTSNGEAATTYVAGTSPGPVSLRATSGPASRTVQLTLTPLQAGQLSLTAGSLTVLADGSSSTTLTATVRDNFGNSVAAGTVVTFQTSLGAIESVTPTDDAGVATARLRPNRFQTGQARVTAFVGNVIDALDVRFVSEDANHIVILESNQPSIGVRGSGSPQTASLTFEVRDRTGIPVDVTHQATVNFTIVPTGGVTDAVLTSASAVTNERGRVLAVVQAGTISGAIEVRAAIGASIISQPIRVAIHGDLPDPDHFSIAFERVNIAGFLFDGILNETTATVGDQHGNPVPDSTAVWFEAAYGLVQGSSFTDDHGQAVVWEITGNPRPLIPGGDGLVLITAQTVSKAGNRITTSGNVMWTGATIVEITEPASGTFNVPNGGAVTIRFRVRDANNNPLVGGTSITAETTGGALGGDIATVLPDTQDDLYTFFSVTLSDNDPGDDDPPTNVTVTITVTSQNGNRVASITGVLD